MHTGRLGVRARRPVRRVREQYVTPPPNPASPVITAPAAPVLTGGAGNTLNNLAWTEPANGGLPIALYELQRDEVTIPGTGDLLTRAYSDAGRTNGVEYDYRVRANNGFAGDWSNTVSLTPFIPGDPPDAPVLSGTAGDAQNSLSWTAPFNGGSAITTYKLHRNTFTIIQDALSPRSKTDTGLTNDLLTPYSYFVVATNSLGDSDPSNTVFLTPTTPNNPNAPTLPANTIVGTPAARDITWSSGAVAFQNNPTTLQTWRDRGYGGMLAGTYNIKLGSGFQNGSENFQPSLLSNGSGNNQHAYAFQPGNKDGSGTDGGGNAAPEQVAKGYRTGVKVYLRKPSQSQNAPPFAEGGDTWFNDALWAAVAAAFARLANAMEFYGCNLLGMDTELGGGFTGWTQSYTGNTRSESVNRAKVRDRGYQVFHALYSAHPGIDFCWYNLYPPGTINSLIQTVVNGAPANENLSFQIDFFHGAADAMKDVGATGRIIHADAQFYRDISNHISGATRPASLKYTSQNGRAWLSTYFDQDVWDYLAKGHYVQAPFRWRGTDGTAFYNSTQPSDATWSAMCAADRLGGEFDVRFEYTHGNGALHWLGGGTNYTSAAMISGAQAAASTSQVSSAAVPTFTNVTAVTSGGGNVTISARAAHLYGIEHVGVYRGSTFSAANPDASYLGACRMIWTPNGGSITTNYDNAYQLCNFITPGIAGDWFVLGARSIKGDRAWRNVQAT